MEPKKWAYKSSTLHADLHRKLDPRRFHWISPTMSCKVNGLKWKGWHAYRRGPATNLHELGVPDKVIQAILRHEDVSTTQRSYIKTVPRVVTDAMKQLEGKISRAADVQQVSVN